MENQKIKKNKDILDLFHETYNIIYVLGDIKKFKDIYIFHI
jgi:hypothetical protein